MQARAVPDESEGSPKPLYREIPTGGQWARRSVTVGDRIGPSVVLRDLGVSVKCRRFEVTCHFCDCVQIRSTEQINASLRRNRPIVCPECLKEGRLIRSFAIQDKRLERVLAGGPTYTLFEIDDMCSDVLSDLEAEFGPSIEDDASIADMTIAAGWPYSAGEFKKDVVAEYIEESEADRMWRREMNNAAFAKRDLEYRMALRRAYERQTEETRAANREYQALLRRAYERDQVEFAKRAQEAAEVLESVIEVGGEVYEPPAPVEDQPGAIRSNQFSRLSRKAPCPCGSRLTFGNCHGSQG
jgi:hypothetical protein